MSFVETVVKIEGNTCTSTHTTCHWKRGKEEGPTIETTFVQDYSTWSQDELLTVVHKKQVIDVGQTHLRNLDGPAFKALNHATIDLATCRGERRVVVRPQTKEEIIENFATMDKDEQRSFMAELAKRQK